MRNLVCFLVICGLASAMPAYASDLTLFGAIQHPGKLTLQRVGETTPSLSDPANFGAFGLRIGGKYFEQTIAYSPNFVESETKAIILGSNLILHLPLPKVRPYGTIGLGSIFTKGDGLADVGTKFALNYGGGVKVEFAGPVGLRFDARNYTIPGFETESLTIQDQTLNVFEVSIGLLFTWGR